MTSSYDIQKIRSTNWAGSVPIVLSLAPTSLSASTMPPPLHKMVSRMTYLHIGLENEVKKMYEFAPALLLKGKRRSKMEPPDNPPDDATKDKNNNGEGSDGESKNKKDDGNINDGNNDGKDDDDEDDIENSYPICWFEDEDTGIALRWHLFVGVLFDLLVRRRRRHNERHHSYNNEGDNETKQEKKDEKDGDITSQPLDLPWKIRVHFTSYPTSQILQFDDHDSTTSSSSSTVLTTVQRFFHHSLKQSVSLQHGSPKVALNMTKANHETYWEALVRCNYDLYQQVNSGLQVAAAVSAPVVTSNECDADELNGEEGEEKGEKSGENGGSNVDVVKKVTRPWDNLTYVPVRLLVDSNPPIQRPFCVYRSDDENNLVDAKDKDENVNISSDTENHTSLGDLLLEWVPNLFHREGVDATVAPIESATWSIQGIQPPLSCPVVDLWQCLCYPDHFLYVAIDTNKV